MSYCLNPVCVAPTNPPTANYCQSCGQSLLMSGTSGQAYRSLKCIGSGGFGRTFLAVLAGDDHQQKRTQRVSAPQQRCVIKQLLPDLQRFRQEVQRLSELGHHPQIPTLIDVIEPGDQGNALYLVQEFIAGLTLEEEITQQGPIHEQKARSLLTDLLTVLVFIHEHRIIHRDIKPQNIIRPTQGGALVLVDFGAAKRTNRASMARTGTVIGSAGYAAPEQIMGKAVFASDLYSLGVTCVHALTGMHPFDLYSISQDQWVWTQYLLNPISPELERLLNGLLCRAVNQRYRTAQAALTDLKALPELSSSSIPLPVHAVNTISQLSKTPSNPASLLQRLKALLFPFPNSSVTSPPPPWLAFTRTSPASPRPHALTPQGLTAPPPQQKSKIQNPKSTIKTSANAPTPNAWHCTHTLAHHTSSVTTLAISPDSTLLASGDRQGTILLWNLESGTLLRQFPAQTLWNREGHGDRITDLQFTSDGITLVSSSADGTLKQWDIGQRKLIDTLEGDGWVMSALTIHPDGHLLISGGANGAIDLWDLTRHQFIQRLWIHTDSISGLELAPDGVILFSGSDDGMIYSWDLRTAEAIASIRAHNNGVSALALHRDGRMIVSGGGDRTLRLWSTSPVTPTSMPPDSSPSFQLLHTLTMHLERVVAIALHPSGTLLTNSQDDTYIQFWKLIQEHSATSLDRIYKRPQRGMTLNQGWTVNALRFSPRGDRFVSCSTDGTIKIWQAQGIS